MIWTAWLVRAAFLSKTLGLQHVERTHFLFRARHPSRPLFCAAGKQQAELTESSGPFWGLESILRLRNCGPGMVARAKFAFCRPIIATHQTGGGESISMASHTTHTHTHTCKRESVSRHNAGLSAEKLNGKWLWTQAKGRACTWGEPTHFLRGDVKRHGTQVHLAVRVDAGQHKEDTRTSSPSCAQSTQPEDDGPLIFLHHLQIDNNC